MRAGADAVLRLDEEPLEFVRAVRVLAGGGVYLSPWATQRLIGAFVSNRDSQRPGDEPFEALTPRERHLVLLVARGLSNREIAERLVISPATVKTHVCRAMSKLEVGSRAKLVALAHQTGFVTDDRRTRACSAPAVSTDFGARAMRAPPG